MTLTVSEANAEIARLVAEGADPWQIAAARERRAIAERREEEQETARLLQRIDEAEGCGSAPDFRLSWQEFRLLRAELRRLKGSAA
ncbi:hypothetical protein [Bosea sp. FBZP-16]|uniref:hypothetical protein n=1 Tax=Bosea sp. FBZP-16 TaxID=2065382 RepID=UPI000C318EC7|nr:hypothetical protein [Bosea sp. FBZP-16]